MTSINEKAEISLRMVREAKVLAYDTETSGVNWTKNFPVGYVFTTDAQNSHYVPVRHGGGGNLPDGNVTIPESADDPIVIHKFEKELAKAFDYRNAQNVGPIVGHNLKFDCHASANGGVLLGRNLVCTQNTEALLDEYSRGFSLDAVAKKYGVTAKLGDGLYQHIADQFGVAPNRNSMSHFWMLAGNDPIAVEYAEGDGVSTIEVHHKQRPLIIQQALNVVYNMENELIWTCFRMERRGIKVDMSYLQELIKTIQAKVADAYAGMPEGFNPRSPIQMKKYVTEAGHTDWPLTEKGNPQFNEKWLETFEAGRRVVDIRKYTNLLNSFAMPLLDEHTHEGRVHATLNQLKSDDRGTISGRFSCSHPNLQQVPKHNKELAIPLRKAFVPDEGMEFYEGDYSQCEPRMFAHYSKDPNLVEGYSMDPPKDVHTIVADMFDVDRGTTGKRMNMGMFTGMFPKALAGHMGWTKAKAQEMWDKWFELFPGIRDFQDLAKRIILERGHVRTLIGRRGRLDKPRFAYRATSKIIQGGNADIIKWKLLEIDKWLEANGDKAHLLMTVHDSIVWQAEANEEGRALSAQMREMMVDVQSEPFNLIVPFKVDLDRGGSWAEASFGEAGRG